jgi:hypothetical protein
MEQRKRWRSPRFLEEEIDEGRVYEALRAQRESLRALLAILETQALEVLRGGPCTAAALAVGIADVAAKLDAHMLRDERARAKVAPRAAKRALAAREDAQRGRREELRALSRLAGRCDDGITLALAARSLVSDARLDLAAEDLRDLAAG